MYDSLNPLPKQELSGDVDAKQTSVRIALIDKDPSGKLRLKESTSIPHIPGINIAFLGKVENSEEMEILTKIEAPSPTTWSNNTIIEDGGKTGIIIRKVKPIGGHVVSFLELDESDPDGIWKVTIYNNKNKLGEAKFSVMSPSDIERRQLEALNSVKAAEDEVNLRRCLNGSLSSLCDRSRLTLEQKVQVQEAEDIVNLRHCLNGSLTSLCDKSRLSPTQKLQARAAEQAVNIRRCYNGNLSSLCDKNLLMETVVENPHLIPQQ